MNGLQVREWRVWGGGGGGGQLAGQHGAIRRAYAYGARPLATAHAHLHSASRQARQRIGIKRLLAANVDHDSGIDLEQVVLAQDHVGQHLRQAKAAMHQVIK